MAQQIEAPPTTEQRRKMSYEEWLAWAGKGSQAEWVKGEGIKFVPPNPVHGLASGFLFRLIADFVELFDLGVVLHSPQEVRLEAIPSSRDPDVFFIGRAHLHRIGPTRIEGPVDLAIEVISPDSVSRDRIEKLAEYERAGVPEYWIFDVRAGKERSQFYRLNAWGRYEEVHPDADGRYHSAVLPGFGCGRSGCGRNLCRRFVLCSI